eukprot:gene14441-10319_t
MAQSAVHDAESDEETVDDEEHELDEAIVAALKKDVSKRYNDQGLPQTLNELVEDVYEFERDRAAIDSRQRNGGYPQHNFGNPQLAIHSAKSTEQRVAKPTDKCFQCNGFGHFKRDCPQTTGKAGPGGKVGSLKVVCLIGNAPESLEPSSVCAHNRVDKLVPTWVYLDSGAETSVFCNADLVEDIHSGPQVTVRTVAGSKKVDQWAYFGPIKVLFDPQSGSNLVSQHDLEEVSEEIQFTPGQSWSSTLKGTGDVLEFFKHEFDEFGDPNKFYCLTPGAQVEVLHSTVAEREKNFTKSELEAARGVRQLKLRLAGASDADIIKFLRDGVALGCPFTPEDVKRASRIYGPDVGTLKGKTTDSGPSKAVVVDAECSEQINQRLYVDIFEVEAQRFVLAVMKPLKYRLCAILDGKSSAHVGSAMKTIMTMIQSRGFRVDRVEIDPDRALLGLEATLGVPVDVVGAGKHVAIAEREGRVVKDRARLIMASLPYVLPARFVKYLVLFIVTRLNLVPSASDGSDRSPRERFTGRKLIYKRNLELGFGEFAEVWAKPEKSSSMEPRTLSAIALYPVGNEHGAWYFYDIVSCTVIQRAQWKTLPTPGALITLMNHLAKEDFESLGRGIPPKLSRATVTMGGVPLDRMIVNPAIEVPRYGPDGTPVQTVTNAHKRRGRGQARTPLGGGIEVDAHVTGGEADAHTAVDTDQIELLADTQDNNIVDDHEMNDHATEEAQEALPNDEPGYDSYDDDSGDRDEDEYDNQDLGYQMVEGVRKSFRIRDKAHRVFQMSVRESVKKLGDAAVAAIHKEFSQMKSMGVFDPVRIQDLDEQQRKTIIHSSAFVKEKTDEAGNVKALYGLVQSSKLWYQHMAGVLRDAGWESNPYDDCVFHKGPLNCQTTVCLHVDDLLVTAPNDKMIEDLVSQLRKSFAEVKLNQGDSIGYLGMRIRRTNPDIEVDMNAYIQDCLEWFEVKGAANTPAESTLFESNETSTKLTGNQKERFHTAVAKLLYAAKRCRPDILTAVSFLTGRVQCCTEEDMAKLERLFKYLNKTKTLGLRFSGKQTDLNVQAFVDAAYGVHDTGESRSGLVITINGTPVLWKSSKQAIVTKSSTEAELVALTDGSTDIIWLRQLLMSQGFPLGPVRVAEDNQPVLAMLERKSHGVARTRHINIRYFFIIDRVKAGDLLLHHMPTDEMLADIFTKPLVGGSFHKMQARLMGQQPSQRDP